MLAQTFIQFALKLVEIFRIHSNFAIIINKDEVKIIFTLNSRNIYLIADAKKERICLAVEKKEIYSENFKAFLENENLCSIDFAKAFNLNFYSREDGIERIYGLLGGFKTNKSGFLTIQDWIDMHFFCMFISTTAFKMDYYISSLTREFNISWTLSTQLIVVLGVFNNMMFTVGDTDRAEIICLAEAFEFANSFKLN